MTTTHLCRQCRITPVLTDGTLCNECAVKGEMPRPDYLHDKRVAPLERARCWHIGNDGTTAIERYAERLQVENARLREALEQARSNLDKWLGDTDPPGDPEDWEYSSPVAWVCYMISQALHSSPAAGGKDEDVRTTK